MGDEVAHATPGIIEPDTQPLESEPLDAFSRKDVTQAISGDSRSPE